MKVTHNYDDKGGKFEATVDGAPAGHLTWVWTPDFQIDAQHTVVEEAHRGSDVGEKLVFALVSFAQESDVKVIPTCDFVQAEFGKHEGYANVKA